MDPSIPEPVVLRGGMRKRARNDAVLPENGYFLSRFLAKDPVPRALTDCRIRRETAIEPHNPVHPAHPCLTL